MVKKLSIEYRQSKQKEILFVNKNKGGKISLCNKIFHSQGKERKF